MAEKVPVTNAMRLLRKAGVPFEEILYDLEGEPFSGEAVRRALGADARGSYKTLCARGERRGIAVYVIPLSAELDLKKAARALGDKAVALVPVKELLPLTGYERGSVSPVGMKKRYPTFIDKSAAELQRMKLSGGMKGVSMALEPRALIAYLGAALADLTEQGPAAP